MMAKIVLTGKEAESQTFSDAELREQGWSATEILELRERQKKDESTE
jgi:hypothetical protein